MTPQQWRRVCELLDDVSGLPRLEQENRLLHLAGEDPSVIAEALRMASGAPGARGFISTPVGSVARLYSAGSIAPGTRIAARFEIRRFLGAGGMGEVYEAFDFDLNDRVALKLLRDDLASDANLVAMFQREVRLARRVTHPNVCRIFDAGRDETSEATFLTMELLEGGSLAGRIKAKALTTHTAIEVIGQLIEALAAAHGAGILHRDLKPGNILFRDLEGRAACITDFGLALADPQAQTTAQTQDRDQSHNSAGTPQYMAPECFDGATPNAATDVYALGLVMYECLTGSLPFGELGPLASIVRRSKEIAPCLPVNLPAEARLLNSLVQRCLEPDPRRRFANALAVKEAFAGKGGMFTLPSWRPSRRTLIRSGIVGAGVSLFVAGARYAWKYQSTPPDGAVLIAAIEAPPDSGLDAIEVSLRQSLRQSARVQLWDNTRLSSVLSRMGRKSGERLDPADWREIALREQTPYVLFPSVSRAGDGLALTLRLEMVNPSTPRASGRKWQRSFDAKNRSDLVEAEYDAVTWLRELMGETRGEISQSNRPPQDITTGSWEALTAFHRAEQRLKSDSEHEALREFEVAARFDSDFTMAWMRQGDLLMGMKRMNEGLVAWDKAIECSRKRPLSRREDLMLRAMFADDTGDFRTSERLFGDFCHYFPNEDWGYFNRALPLLNLNLINEAISTLEACSRFPARARSMNIQLSQANVARRQFDEAAKHVAVLHSLGHHAWADRCEAAIHFGAGRSPQALESLQKSKVGGNAEWTSAIELYELSVLPALQRPSTCLELAKSYAIRDETSGFRMSAAMKFSTAGYFALQCGQEAEGRILAHRALSLDTSTTTAVRVGTLLARLGSLDDVEPLFKIVDLPLDVPRVRAAKFRLQGERLLAQKKPEAALKLLDKARADEIQPYGHEYFARALQRAGLISDAARVYREVDAGRLHQMRLLYPDPPAVLDKFVKA